MRQTGRENRKSAVFARILIWFGILALALSIAGLFSRARLHSDAEESTQQVLERLQAMIPAEPDPASLPASLENGPKALPLLQVSGVVCAGILTIEELRKQWPVGGLYEQVRSLPCLVEKKELPSLIIIEGMDYESQFGILRQLAVGDKLLLTDVNGIKYRFHADYTGTDPGRREEEWDLELVSYMGEEMPYCVGCVLE